MIKIDLIKYIFYYLILMTWLLLKKCLKQKPKYHTYACKIILKIILRTVINFLQCNAVEDNNR